MIRGVIVLAGAVAACVLGTVGCSGPRPPSPATGQQGPGLSASASRTAASPSLEADAPLAVTPQHSPDGTVLAVGFPLWLPVQPQLVALTHDRARAVVAGAATIAIVDTATGRVIRTVPMGHDWIGSMALARDTDRLVTSSGLGEVCVSALGAEPTCATTGQPIAHVAIAPDGTHVVAWLRGPAAALLWDSFPGQPARVDVGGGAADAIAVDQRGTIVIAQQGRIVTIDGPSARVATRTKATAETSALSADGATAALWRKDAVDIYDVGAGRKTQSVRVGPMPRPCRLALSPSARWVAVGDLHSALRVFDVATGGEIALPTSRSDQHRAGRSCRIGGGIHPILSVRDSIAVSDDGSTLATVMGPGQEPAPDWAHQPLCLYDLTTSRAVVRVERHSAEVQSIAPAPNGISFAAATEQGSFVWDLATATGPRWIGSPTSFALSAAWSLDGRTLAVVEEDPDGEIAANVYEASNGNRAAHHAIKQDASLRVAFDARSRLVVMGHWGPLYRQDDSGRLIETQLDSQHTAAQPVFSPRGRWMAHARKNQVVIRDLATLAEVRAIDAKDTLIEHALAFSHDETRVLFAWREALAVVDMATGKEVCRWPRSGVRYAAFRPDDALVATLRASDGRASIDFFEVAGCRLVGSRDSVEQGEVVFLGSALILSRGIPDSAVVRRATTGEKLLDLGVAPIENAAWAIASNGAYETYGNAKQVLSCRGASGTYPFALCSGYDRAGVARHLVRAAAP